MPSARLLLNALEAFHVHEKRLKRQGEHRYASIYRFEFFQFIPQSSQHVLYFAVYRLAMRGILTLWYFVGTCKMDAQKYC